MSKSRGNVVTPMDSLRQHGSDAVRYWAASGRLGTDMIFDPAQLRVGRRLAIKILNASKFILSLPDPDAHRRRGARRGPGVGPRADAPGQITEALDRAMLGRLADVVAACTAAFEDVRAHPGAAGGRVVLLVLLRRLPGAGQVPGLPGARRAGRRVGHRRAARRAVGAAPAVRAGAPVRHRGSVVLVAGRVGAPGRLAGPGRAAGAGRPGGPGRAGRRVGRHRGGARGQVSRPAVHARAGRASWSSRPPRTACPGSARCSATCRRRARWTRWCWSRQPARSRSIT